MIYAIVGTDKGIKDKAIAEMKSFGEVSCYVYSEQADDLESLISSASLFGEIIIVSCVSLMDQATSKEELLRLLPQMEESTNIFIIDEPFADIHKYNKLKKVAKKLFDAREVKKKDSSLFAFCMAFARRDKKAAWLGYMDIKERESPEAIQGALWWKWREVWGATLSGKKTAFSKVECESFGESIMKSSVKAHRGELDLSLELERIVLSL